MRIRPWLIAAFGLLLVARTTLLLLSSDSPPRWLDGHWLYVAGVVWAQGASPYDVSAFFSAWEATVPIPTRAPFLYPPTLAVISLPLAALPWELARQALDGLNILALAAVLGLCAAIVRRWAGDLSTWAWAALCLAVLASPHAAVVYLGQTGLIALAGALGAVYWARARPWLAAGCVVVATIKPQLTALLLLWAVLQTDWRPIVAGLAIAAVLSLGIVGATHEGSILEGLRASSAGHMAREHNAVEHYAGVYGLLGPLGLPARSFPFFALLGAGCLWLYARRLPGLTSLLAAVALTGLLLPIHAYDYSAYALVLVALPVLPRGVAIALVPGLLLAVSPRIAAPAWGALLVAVPIAQMAFRGTAERVTERGDARVAA